MGTKLSTHCLTLEAPTAPAFTGTGGSDVRFQRQHVQSCVTSSPQQPLWAKESCADFSRRSFSKEPAQRVGTAGAEGARAFSEVSSIRSHRQRWLQNCVPLWSRIHVQEGPELGLILCFCIYILPSPKITWGGLQIQKQKLSST